MRFNDPTDYSWSYFNPEDGTLTPNQIPDPWTASYSQWIEKKDFYSDTGGNIKLQLGDNKVLEKKIYWGNTNRWRYK